MSNFLIINSILARKLIAEQFPELETQGQA